MASNNPSKVFVALKKFRGESRHQPTNSAETDAAAQMLHRIQIAHGPQQWRNENLRLMHEYERTHDFRHLRALQRHTKAMEKWAHDSQS